jgi:hypothetical protein
MTRWVVATSQKEAEDVAEEIGHETKAAALDHLKLVQASPTDPHYASQYKVFRVVKEAGVTP